MKKLVMTLAVLLLLSTTAFAGSVYEVLNPNNGLPLYTADQNEYNILRYQYRYMDFYSQWTAPENGQPVYRLYNPSSGHHLYTLDTNEVRVLTSQHGWVSDNNGQPVFYSGGTFPVYRFYDTATGRHFLTTTNTFYDEFVRYGWNNEGIKMYGLF